MSHYEQPLTLVQQLATDLDASLDTHSTWGDWHKDINDGLVRTRTHALTTTSQALFQLAVLPRNPQFSYRQPPYIVGEEIGTLTQTSSLLHRQIRDRKLFGGYRDAISHESWTVSHEVHTAHQPTITPRELTDQETAALAPHGGAMQPRLMVAGSHPSEAMALTHDYAWHVRTAEGRLHDPATPLGFILLQHLSTTAQPLLAAGPQQNT